MACPLLMWTQLRSTLLTARRPSTTLWQRLRPTSLHQPPGVRQTFATLPSRFTGPPSNGYRRFNNQVPFYASKRFWIFVGTGTVIYGGYYVTHLETVPITGRTRFMDVTPRQEEAMARQAYQEVMAQFGHRILPQNHPYSMFVRRIAKRIVHVAGMDNLAWEFHVIDSPERNAFVLPGGKVFVFTGILPIVQNEDGMAAVLGHEIAHQLARHSAEKLSFSKIILVLQLTLWLFGIDPSYIFNRLALGLTIEKPFSRKCEKEADIIGLQLMAQACFDPREAIGVWQRMESAGGDHIPQFASTHPSHRNRVAILEKEMPNALEKQSESDCSTQLRGLADRFNTTWSRW